MEELIGEFDQVTYTNDEGSWMIGVLSDKTCVKGNVINGKPPFAKLEYRFAGRWENHPKFGRQFAFNAYVLQEPRSREAVITYICRFASGCGIGTVTAAKIVDRYGPDKAIGVLKWEPEKVASEIPRLSVQKCREAARRLIDCGKMESTMIEIGQLLNGRGFPQATIELIVKKWKAMAPEIIRRDPFKLLVNRFKGAGFGRCDALYKDLGLPIGRRKRQMLCLWSFMRKDMSGSVWFPMRQLDQHLKENCGGEVDVEKAVRFGVRAGWLTVEEIGGERWVSSAADAGDETEIAECVGAMLGNGEVTVRDWRQRMIQEELRGIE